jgi:hypothetical protein
MMTRTIARRRTFGAVAAVVLLVLSACGGAAGDTPPPDADAQALAFAQCMRDNGVVDFPDPAPGQELSQAFQHQDVQAEDQATIDRATAACEDLLPQQEHEGGHDAEREETELALAECLRAQGLDVPDDLGGLSHDADDELLAAMEKCRDEIAGGDHE